MKLGRSHWNLANPAARRHGHNSSFRCCWNPSWRINYTHRHIDLSAQLLRQQTMHHDESLFAHRPTNPVLKAVRLVANNALTGFFHRFRENSLTFTSPESVRLPVRLPPTSKPPCLSESEILTSYLSPTLPTRNRPTHHRQGPRLDPDPDR
jgi:hypothetical protein